MPVSAATPPIHRRHLDKFAFFGALLLGIVVIVGFERVGRPKQDAVIGCVALIFAYAGAVTLLPALKLRIDQAADNCYYLGLLFTLTSLGAALFSFNSAEGATEAILRNFGVAIFTTIFGLGLRVLISQFRQDPEDLEQEAREALAETVRRLRGDLDFSVAELQRFTDGVRQALQETAESARSSTAETLTAAIQRFEGALIETTRSFNENSTGFNKRAAAINTSLDKVAGAVETLTIRIASVRADELMIRDALQPAFDAVGGALTGFTSTLDAQRERIDRSVATLGDFADVLGRFQVSTGVLAQASQDLQASIAALREGPAQFERLGAATRLAADAGELLSKSVQDAASRAGDAAEASISRLEAASVSLTQQTASRLEAVTDAAARATDTLSRLNQEFAGSGETVEKVRRELTELAGWIIARLERA